MPIITGRDAYVNGVKCVTGWALTGETTAEPYFASCVPGASGVPAGNENWTGLIRGIGSQPVLFPDGVEINFAGKADHTGAGVVYNAIALVEQLTINVPIAAGTVINWEATIGLQGAPSFSTGTFLDTAGPEGTSASLAGVGFGDGIDEFAIPDVQNYTMTFTRALSTFVRDGLFYRAPNDLEAAVQVELKNNRLHTQLALNSLDVLKCYTSGSLHWRFNWGRVQSNADFVVDRASREIVGYNVNFLWSAISGVTLGSIRAPDLSFKYGT